MSRSWVPSPRRRRRNVLLLAGLVPSLIAVLVGSALLLMLVRGNLGLAATAHGDQDAAVDHFAANRWFGTVEHWVAPYDEGVASYRADAYDAALAAFLAALHDVPDDQECRVLDNIAATQERLGDHGVQARDPEAITRYQRGREALAAGRCLERDDQDPGIVPRAAGLDARLQQKIADLLARRQREEQATQSTRQQRQAAALEHADQQAQAREERIQERKANDGSGPVRPPGRKYGY